MDATSTGAVVIQSPNYPYEYGNNINSNYTIVASTGKVILLTFDTFVVEENYDFVQVKIVFSYLCILFFPSNK